MIKRTLYISQPYYLSVSNNRLKLSFKESKGIDKLFDHYVPLEDIGVLILDHQQITITQNLLEQVANYNIAFITCNHSHHPALLQLPLDVNTLQQERFEAQINATEPLKKQLWQQTIKAKIKNQGLLLNKLGFDTTAFIHLEKEVKSGDTGNIEARAAIIYWKYIFSRLEPNFTRDRFAPYPNNFLNYGYAILRAIVARNLVGSGLLPTMGIFHKNRYNAYCLADDIMEPYRVYVDEIVYQLMVDYSNEKELTKEIKQRILQLPVIDVKIDGNKSPLMVATQKTTSSLAKCFEGSSKKILYPALV